MSEFFFSELGLLCYLQELRKEELWKLKELLQQECLKLKLKPIPWAELKKANREGLAGLLSRHYPGRSAWELMLSLLLQVQRSDLWAKAQTEMHSQCNPYQDHMRERLRRTWNVEARLPVPDHFYRDTMENEYRALVALCALPERPAVVILGGPEGMGKTTLLRKVMLDWAEGNIWQDCFTFVFLINCWDLNQVPETSVEELLARDWPTTAQPLEAVLQRPEQILVVVDGLDLVKFEVEMQGSGCGHWRQRAAPAMVLGSLLQRRVLSEAAIVVALNTKEGDEQRSSFHGQSAAYVILSGFRGSACKLYFNHFFHSSSHASRALAYVESNSALVELCCNPLACWLICCCLKGQLARGQSPSIPCNSATSLYLSFITNVFPCGTDGRSPAQNRERLRSLCALAAEGVWTSTFAFEPAHLSRNGVSEADVQAWLGRRLLQQSDGRVAFAHVCVQDFCASLFYVLRRPGDAPNPHIGSVAQLLAATLGAERCILGHIAIFLVALTSEGLVQQLEAALGCALGRETRAEVVASLRDTAARYSAQNPVNLHELFSCLFETQDQGFVGEMMDLFPDLSLTLRGTESLLLTSFCLRSCGKLKKLHLMLDPSFASPADEKRLSAWREFCLVFTNCSDFSMLEMDCSTLDSASLTILYKVLARQACKLQWLVCMSVPRLGHDSSFFKLLLHSPHLTHLSLYGSCLSHVEVQQLCSALKHPHCSIRELMLGKCNILKENCRDVASVLESNRHLKVLSLVENPIMDDGMRDLCIGLMHPNCTLELLMLMYCCLSSVSCDYISQALLYNRSLTLLDLSLNYLEDTGAASLCQALYLNNNIRQLWLTGCYLGPGCCGQLSSLLIGNDKLRALKLGRNPLEDAGVQVLCAALKHPNCKVETLGLDFCHLSPACCTDLASALTSCQSLRSLNLEGLRLDPKGAEFLCAALSNASCGLQVLGLDSSEFDQETQALLSTVANASQLTITPSPWAADEKRVRGLRG